MFGFLNIYKPKGKTSHDVVAILRRITRIKQIGHTGTLDPFAEGVLPICIGKSTRLIEYLDDDKAYVATVQLGRSTTTYDIEGEYVNSSDKKVSLEDIKAQLNYFKGKIQQYPPIYSAIKVNGKKLYEYARKGESVEVKPREVEIYKLEIISYDENNRILELCISCSKGTYIRSIANDLGEKLGTYGYLTKLVRIKAGKFLMEKSTKLDEIDSIENVEAHLIYPLDYLNYPRYEINDVEKEKISHGMSIKTELDDGIVILTQNNELISIAETNSNITKTLKVFI